MSPTVTFQWDNGHQMLSILLVHQVKDFHRSHLFFDFLFTQIKLSNILQLSFLSLGVQEYRFTSPDGADCCRARSLQSSQPHFRYSDNSRHFTGWFVEDIYAEVGLHGLLFGSQLLLPYVD